MIYWAIRKRGTDLLLPLPRRDRSASERVFEDTGAPHLFTAPHHAESVLRHWLPFHGVAREQVDIVPISLQRQD